MNLCKCDKGHFYDKEKYITCPHCAGGSQSISDNDNFAESIIPVVTDLNESENSDYYKKEITDLNRWAYLQQIKNELLDINHKNIVKIYDIYTANNKNYIKEEYIIGKTVEHIIQYSKISLEVFLNIGISLCNALKYLNKKHMVYMDIKPSNIMYNSENKEAYLIDIDSIYFKKSLYNIKFYGTIEYSSPEQILYSQYNTQGSVYSLGLVFYKMLTKTLPFNISKKGIQKKVTGELDFNVSYFCDFKYKNVIINLIKNMVLIDESERINIKNVFQILLKIKKEATEKDLNQTISNENNDDSFNYDSITFTKFEDDVTCTFYEDTSKKETYNILEQSQRNTNNDLIYRNELLKEYHNILTQTQILFYCWISALLVCYIIVAICIYCILNKRLDASIFSLILEGLVFAIQKIFAIREDYYHDLISKKIEHLQQVDLIEYTILKTQNIDDKDERNKQVINLIDDIRNRWKSKP